ncbi:Lipid A biosynthesis lauroyl acyltransferase [Pigmentiphaga humi]|uniref:Lipid A biosynthesis lauroyl acyltransferase n=1 Tax=Pigmentiphaga humi TaxID=2478468 RepID=A0A3P4AVH8_9BURK|nr:lysophospholipid acyltransferase family protein [Pigmentiphaga humi]VCU68033.1 Lipid A biosynthesis lauroyl acyltransferase [Pigmentiphaga humi]
MLLTLYRLLARLPLGWLHGMGRMLGRVVYRSSAEYAERLRANAALAGYRDEEFARRAAESAGEGALEIPRVWFKPDQALAQCRSDDWDVVQQAHDEGKGILLLTPHLGCFEVAARYCAHRGGPITVLYRPPRKAWMAQLVEGGRRGPNLDTAPANLQGVRQLVRALRRGEAIGILPDQVPGNGEGVWAPFFGKPAFSMVLPGRLAAQTGAAVVLVAAERLSGAQGWKIHFARLPGPVPETAEDQATWVNAGMEAMIRRCPEQYLWGYNRYKAPKGEPPPMR